MKQRNGAGSKRLVEATHRFIRSEQKLLEVLFTRRILKKTDCDHFAKDLDVSASKKRSSDVFGSAIAINKKLMGVLASSKASTRAVKSSAIEVLYEMSRVVQTIEDPSEALRQMLVGIREGIPFENATLFVTERATGKLEPVATVGEPIDLIGHVKFDRGRGFSSWVAQQRKPVLLNDLHREGGTDAPSVRSFLSVPIVLQGEAMGVINLSHSRPEAFDEESQKLLSLMGHQIAGIVNRVILRREMERLQTTDDLTSLYNKRHFDKSLDAEIEKAKRYGHKLSVMVLDIDNFKALSERHGQPAGNEVLSDFGKLLKKFARGTDCVARSSGEEFMILLPHTDASEARCAADRLRLVVEAHSFPRRKRLTVSVGIATFPIDANDSVALLVRADQALFQSRNDPPKPSPAVVSVSAGFDSESSAIN
ncbi:MAG TPA: sensor domain-containing diguanylate cyclase [Candidatus Limnocylindrales bacterium]|nr:sensor domain-containing diguanylate cyclase [Candidatus Limnocylindrales bacterium]